MAIIKDMDREAWQKWVETLPKAVRRMCEKYPPDRLYLLKSSGHRVTICSYNRDGTVTVNIGGEYNRVMFQRHVFGIDINDLEECDLPSDNEVLGEILTNRDEIVEYIDHLRRQKRAKNN